MFFTIALDSNLHKVSCGECETSSLAKADLDVC
jgi:hypothetical protein